MKHWTITPWAGRYWDLKYWTWNTGSLQVFFMAGLLWFRLFGKGLHIRSVRLHPLLFANRHRRPLLTLGSWQVRWLT